MKTGMFDRNASTQRIKALVETRLALAEDRKPAAETAAKSASPRAVRTASGGPRGRAEPLPKLRPGESAGFDPYGRGPSKPTGGRR